MSDNLRITANALENLRIGDKVKTQWGNNTYTIASFTPIGDVSIAEVPGIFNASVLTLITPKWEVGDRGIYPDSLIEFTVLDFRPDGNLITDYVMEDCGVQWFPPEKCKRIAIATDETRGAAHSFYNDYWVKPGAAVNDHGYTFTVEYVWWDKDGMSLKLKDRKSSSSFPARECTRVDKPELIETTPEMRDQWRGQIIGTRTVRYLNGGTIRIGQCDVSVYPLNRSDVPAVNLRVSNAGIRSDELRQLAALLNEVADVLDS
ncbi:hypothetical protein HMSP1_24 [Sinorhizobium phage HMSP1-Susan]|nr:hypothetical protein HMSP1_24 [Sinorhizobium phage HMSP1-Susan]